MYVMALAQERGISFFSLAMTGSRFSVVVGYKGSIPTQTEPLEFE